MPISAKYAFKAMIIMALNKYVITLHSLNLFIGAIQQKKGWKFILIFIDINTNKQLKSNRL